MTKIDYILLAIFLVFFLDGCRKGLFRCLIGPASFLAFLLIGIINYDAEGNAIKSILLVFIGSMICTTVINIALFFARRKVDPNFRNASFLISRILGGVVSLFWKGGMTLIILTLLTLIPQKVSGQIGLLKELTESRTYAWLKEKTIQSSPTFKTWIECLRTITNAEELQTWRETSEYQNFFNYPKVTAVLEDSELMERLKNNGVKEILSNQKIKDLMNDETAMTLLSRLSERIYETKSKAIAAESAAQSNKTITTAK